MVEQIKKIDTTVNVTHIMIIDHHGGSGLTKFTIILESEPTGLEWFTKYFTEEHGLDPSLITGNQVTSVSSFNMEPTESGDTGQWSLIGL